MKQRIPTSLLLVLLASFALPAGAASLVKYKEWDRSPEFLMLATDAEKKEWSAVQTDDDAEKFAALFWARRDPDLKTPVNEFKQAFEARVAQADQSFALGRKKGSATERGKLFILVGAPKSVIKRAGSEQQEGGALPGSPGAATGGGQVVYRFHYEKQQLPEWAGMSTLDAGFLVDETLQSESIVENTSAVRKLETKAAEHALAHPELKQAPVYKTREQVEAETRAASEAQAEANRGPTLSAPVRDALEKALAKEPHGKLIVMPLADRNGSTRLMLQILEPNVPSPQSAKLAVLVKSKDGKDAARKEEPAALQKSKGDFFTDRSIVLAPGDYDVAAALLDGSGSVIATGRRAVTVAPVPTEFSASAVLLAYNDMPAEGAKPDDAFVFAQRKFVARGDGRFEKSDGLSYVVRVYNASIDPANKTTFIKKTVKIKPKSGPAIDVPSAPDAPTPAPDLKDPKDALYLDVGANIVPEDLGNFFKPGDHTLKVTLTDVVTGKTVEASAPFTLVAGPDTAKPAPAAPKKK